MLTRLTTACRFWAASLLVAGYVVCILASTVALASANGPRAAHSFGHAHHGVAGNVAEADDAPAGHAHSASHTHHDGIPHQHPTSHDGDESSSSCCGIACINALPASLPDVANAVMSAGVPIAMVQESTVGGGPPLLYRPPISL